MNKATLCKLDFYIKSKYTLFKFNAQNASNYKNSYIFVSTKNTLKLGSAEFQQYLQKKS